MTWGKRPKIIVSCLRWHDLAWYKMISKRAYEKLWKRCVIPGNQLLMALVLNWFLIFCAVDHLRKRKISIDGSRSSLALLSFYSFSSFLVLRYPLGTFDRRDRYTPYHSICFWFFWVEDFAAVLIYAEFMNLLHSNQSFQCLRPQIFYRDAFQRLENEFLYKKRKLMV